MYYFYVLVDLHVPFDVSHEIYFHIDRVNIGELKHTVTAIYTSKESGGASTLDI